jgi:NADP-dependent 3-hydroxy acid dehydrogenase YdfG
MDSYIKENYVKDKVIIITGASAGFARATALKAAAMGGKVVLAARRENKLKEVTEQIRAAGGEAIYKVTDIRYQDQVESLVKLTMDTYGRIDVLCNIAGTMPTAPYLAHEWAMDAWVECIDTNIKGTLFCTCAVYDQMIKQGEGHIINFSSIMGNYPAGGAGVYCASKACDRFLAESLRQETRGKIKTTVIRPTYCTKTDLTDTVIYVDYVGLMNSIAMGGMTKNPALQPELLDRDSMMLCDPDPEDLADSVIYAINQPMGVEISDITVRTGFDSMFN